MHILALETNIDTLKKRLMSPGEKEVLTTYYHGASFFFASIKETFYTMLLFGIGIVAWELQAPMEYVVTILFGIWVIFVFFTLFRAFIDWCFDFVLITSDRTVLVDQTSFIRQRVLQIHHENIASVSSETQFLDIFRFGRIVIKLKEGEGENLRLKYVPNSKEVASQISGEVTRYQRRNVAKAAEIPKEAVPEHQETPVQTPVS